MEFQLQPVAMQFKGCLLHSVLAFTASISFDPGPNPCLKVPTTCAGSTSQRTSPAQASTKGGLPFCRVLAFRFFLRFGEFACKGSRFRPEPQTSGLAPEYIQSP